MRIKSAASVVSALSSAQQHNARHERVSSRGGTPAVDSNATKQAEPVATESPKPQDRSSNAPETAEENKPRGLLDRLENSEKRNSASNGSVRPAALG